MTLKDDFCEANTTEKIGGNKMFEENEKPVTEEVTENVEQTTEETIEQPTEEVEKFTKEQVDEIVDKRIKRREAKIRKEYEKKYGRLETVVNAGLGTDNTEEAVEKLTEFYQNKGINIPTEPQYSDRDLEVLANAEAEEIISLGQDEVIAEGERLANLGKNMSKRDKLVLERLVNERKKTEEINDLASIGVSSDILTDPDYLEYTSKLNPALSIKEKYEMYQSQLEKKQNKTIGSMKGVPESKYKDYYTREEISKLTEEDLDDPRVWEAVRKSMTHQN